MIKKTISIKIKRRKLSIKFVEVPHTIIKNITKTKISDINIGNYITKINIIYPRMSTNMVIARQIHEPTGLNGVCRI